MIARIISEIYDTEGKETGNPISKKQKRLFHATFPMQRYLSQPLQYHAKNIEDIRSFLMSCKYISDQEQFDKEDYWMPPEKFEKIKQGDCDDFSLWTWRQLLAMGYDARYVVGISGKYGEGHAWVTFQKNGIHFLVEPLASLYGKKLPSLSTVTYEPNGSVRWDGKNLQYFFHNKKTFKLRLSQIPYLVSEWTALWTWFWIQLVFKIALFPFFLLRKVFRRTFQKKLKKNRDY